MNSNEVCATFFPLGYFMNYINILNLQIKMEKAAKHKGKAPLPSSSKPSWRLFGKLKPSSKYMFSVFI